MIAITLLVKEKLSSVCRLAKNLLILFPGTLVNFYCIIFMSLSQPKCKKVKTDCLLSVLIAVI